MVQHYGSFAFIEGDVGRDGEIDGLPDEVSVFISVFDPDLLILGRVH